MAKRREEKDEVEEVKKEEPKKNPDVICDPNETLAYGEKGNEGKEVPWQEK